MNRKEKVFTAFLWVTLAGILMMTLMAVGQKTRDSKGTTVESGYFDSSENQGKIEQLERVLTANPDDFSALVALGDLYYDMKSNDEAISYFLRAEKLRPRDTHVLNDLGNLYSRQGNSDLAISKFQAAYDVDPTHLVSLYNVAQIYMLKKRDNQKALELFREILSKNPNEELRQAIEREMNSISGR